MKDKQPEKNLKITSQKKHYFLNAVEKKEVKIEENPSFISSNPYGNRTGPLNLKNQEDAPSYNVIGSAKQSKARSLITGLKSIKEMFILQEIIGLPKSLR